MPSTQQLHQEIQRHSPPILISSQVKCFVVYGYDPGANATVQLRSSALPVLSWAQLLELGSDAALDAQLEERTAAVQPGHCTALVYTSGTTGEPKVGAWEGGKGGIGIGRGVKVDIGREI